MWLLHNSWLGTQRHTRKLEKLAFSWLAQSLLWHCAMKKNRLNKSTWLLTVASAYTLLPGCAEGPEALTEENIITPADASVDAMVEAPVPGLVVTPDAMVMDSSYPPGTIVQPKDAEVADAVCMTPDAELFLGIIPLGKPDASCTKP